MIVKEYIVDDSFKEKVQIGERRKFAGVEYEKTAQGWKTVNNTKQAQNVEKSEQSASKIIFTDNDLMQCERSISMGELLVKAINIAVEAHKNQVDKNGMPYIGHVMRVMEAGKTEDEKIVGVLHDLVEDTNWIFEQLEQEFPKYIVEAIQCLTKISEDEPYDDFIERVKNNHLATKVKINDLSDNMDIRRLNILTEKDYNRLRKYHSANKYLQKSLNAADE